MGKFKQMSLLRQEKLEYIIILKQKVKDIDEVIKYCRSGANYTRLWRDREGLLNELNVLVGEYGEDL